MTDSVAGPKYLSALTGLRFIAALHVVAFHLRGVRMLQLDGYPLLDNFVGHGYIAVSLFFVLSGFVLAYTQLDDTARQVSRWQFYLSRFSRIYPVYLLGLLVTFPFFYSGMRLSMMPASEEHTLFVGGLAMTLTQAWLPEAALKWNAPGWSLSAEAFFYFMFPLLAFTFAGRSRISLTGAAVRWWLLAITAPLIYMLWPQAVRENTGWTDGTIVDIIKYNPLVRLPEFVIGIVVGKLFLVRSSQSSSRSGLLTSLSLGSVAAIVGILAVTPSAAPGATSLPSGADLLVHNGLLAPLFAVLIYSLAAGVGPLSWLLSLPTLVLFGEASYALYILHTPVIQYLRATLVITRTQISPALAALLATMVSLLLSTIVYRRFEVPARNWIRRLASPHPKPIELPSA